MSLISPSVIEQLPTSQITGLRAMVTAEIAAATITSNQISAMSSAQVVGLSEQLTLKQNASSALTTAQVNSMITSAIGGLATAPVSSVAGRTGAVTLTTADIAGLSSAPVTSVAGRTGAVALTTSDIGGLSTLAVTTAQVVGLDARTDSRIAGASITTAQISGLTSVPLSSTQINALTLQTNQINGLDARVDSRIASGAMTTSQITGLSAALATKLDASSSITTAQVTGFDSRVDSRIAAGSMTTAQITGLATALSGKSNTGHTHTASQVTDFSTAADARITAAAGVSICPLTGGLVPSGYLPSYVDDIIESATVAALPGTGETGKIYVITTGGDTGKIYRWSGSAYVEISPSPGTTDAVPEGSTNLYHTAARVNALIAAANITTTQISGLTKAAVGLGNVDNVADASKSFTTNQISGLLPLVTSQIAAAAIGTQQITGLTSVALSSTQIAGITGLTTAQVTGFDSRVDSRIAAGSMTTTQITGLAASLAPKANAAAPALTGAGTFATLQGTLLTATQASLTSASVASLTATGLTTLKAVAEQGTALTSSGGVCNIDLSLGTKFTLTLTENITSFTFSNLPTKGGFELRILQNASVARTVAFTFTGQTLSWGDAGAPVMTTTLNKADNYAFSIWAANSIDGFVGGKGF